MWVCVYREMMFKKQHGAGVCVCVSVCTMVDGGFGQASTGQRSNSYGYLGPVNQTSSLGLEAPLAGSSGGQKEPARGRRGLENQEEKLGPAEGRIHSGQRAQCNPP